MDKNLSKLLQWSIENSTTPTSQPTTNGTNGTNDGPAADAPASAPNARSNLTPEVLAAMMGGPSDGELMHAAMTVISSPDASVTLDDRLTAFDNFEQLIESLDNANNMAALSLWKPLLACLSHEEADLRRMAAWCVGTAVQNNAPSQSALLAEGGLRPLVDMAFRPGEEAGVRRKAVYALSSAVRNHQEAMDLLCAELARVEGETNQRQVDAKDMDEVNKLMDEIRQKTAAR